MVSLCGPADDVTVSASRWCYCMGQLMLICGLADAVTVRASRWCHCICQLMVSLYVPADSSLMFLEGRFTVGSKPGN
ncbi:hypothetical protein RRG08_045614 [Elysia crispata]|uniref:Uncharacterized protein n=1 Tax=Elysia crispata TaxID=231223 RepID=A0AAE1AD22_9GAST|nr:hypothetical protein RRG08_045614 [Elysia crispata]